MSLLEYRMNNFRISLLARFLSETAIRIFIAQIILKLQKS